VTKTTIRLVPPFSHSRRSQKDSANLELRELAKQASRNFKLEADEAKSKKYFAKR